MRARVTPEDLQGGKLVDNGWYLLLIHEYQEKPAKSDTSSTNGIFDFKIVCDLQGNEKFKGARSRQYMNEKATMIHPNPKILIAIGFKVDPKNGIDASVDKKVVGRYIEGYVGRTKDDKGKEYNGVLDAEPLGTNFSEEILAKYGQKPAPRPELPATV